MKMNKITYMKNTLIAKHKSSVIASRRRSNPILALLLAFSLVSCVNNIQPDEISEDSTSTAEPGIAYITLCEPIFGNNSRTIAPGESVDYNSSNLTNLVFTAQKKDTNGDEIGTAITLASAEAYSGLSNKKIPIEPGTYDLKLTATLSGAPMEGLIPNKVISIGLNTSISFQLSAPSDFIWGGCNLSITFNNSDNKISKVTITLKKCNKEEGTETLDGTKTLIETKDYNASDFEGSGTTKTIKYMRNVANESERLEYGYYYITFDFYKIYDAPDNRTDLLNSICQYMYIDKGHWTTWASTSLNYNDVYNISYKFYVNDVEDSTYTPTSGLVFPGAYSSRSEELEIPEVEKDGYIFLGWYTDNTFATRLPENASNQQVIEAGSAGSKTLCARFIKPELYVSENGDDTKNGLTESTALASITRAIEKIVSYGNISTNYTIKVSGTITGGQSIGSTLTTDMATSLTLEGVTGKSGDTWVDILNGGFTSSSKGTTLAINTAVPVTLKNLKITGGYQGGGSGGGIKLAGDSSLVMESGEISGNTGTDSGQASAAGVYISQGGTSNFGATQIAGAKFTMTGGSICNNIGTGVAIYDGSNPGEFNMNGGTITGNSGYGVNLVYSTGPSGKFTMKGSATVTSDNKVRLGHPGNTKIYIADALTGTAPVATITLNGYNENTEVVALADGVTDTGTLLSAACAKFEVAPDNGTPWYLTSDGKLTATNPNSGTGGGGNGGNGMPTPDNTNMVMMNGTRSYLLSGDYETSTLGDYYNIIDNMYVGKQEITQAEFEKYMIYYGTAVGKGLVTGIEDTSTDKDYKPADSDNKSTTPAYYVSYPDALVYCNLRSKAEGFTPVYSMKLSDGTFSSDPNDWIGVVEVGKMTDTEDENKTKFYTYTTYDNDSDWHPKEDYGRFMSDLKATGYRLPTLTEWKYIASQNLVLGLSDCTKNVSEWTTFYNYNGNSDFANYPQSINTKDELTPNYNYAYSHDIENIGFRVVRYVNDAASYEYEDFELPSGLLWATCNVGADNPYDYGDYFAWGEVNPRYGPEEWKYSDNYRWQSYFDGSSGSNFTKYKASGTTELQSDNDTATKNMGEGWTMPTKTQLQELIDNTFITAIDDYKATGVSGVIVYKPKNDNDKGKNDIYSGDSGYVATPEGTYNPATDTHIFFPANGYRNEESEATTGYDVCIWTRTLNTTEESEAYFWAPAHKDQWDTIDDEPRYYGMGVRGVKQP